jgi:acetyl/propionyl-CoA carboxylase alpha subunit
MGTLTMRVAVDVNVDIVYGDRDHRVQILADGRVRVGDKIYDVRRERDGSVRIGDRAAWVAAANGIRWVFLDGHAYELTESRPKVGGRGGGHDGSLSAPMPATVRRIVVKTGDVVKAGDPLVVLEAMKMEMPIRATEAGTVRALRCEEGELVQPGVPLLEIDPA